MGPSITLCVLRRRQSFGGRFYDGIFGTFEASKTYWFGTYYILCSCYCVVINTFTWNWLMAKVSIVGGIVAAGGGTIVSIVSIVSIGSVSRQWLYQTTRWTLS